VYEPISLNLETYENYCTSINNEIDDTVDTNNIKNENDSKKMLNLQRDWACLGNDAKNKQNEFILLYVVVADGKLEIKVKFNKKENMT